jgi:hypothetical protein
VSDERLRTERRGGSFDLTPSGFFKLVEGFIRRCSRQRMFEEVLGVSDLTEILGGRHGRHDPADFFTFRLGDPWAAEILTHPSLIKYRSEDEALDLLELLYKEVISLPADGNYPPARYDEDPARREYLAALNPILDRREPSLSMEVTGNIVERVAEPFRRLVEQPLPADTPKVEVADRVADAVTHYQRRGATPGDRRAAVRELADVLEFLRADVKEHMLRKDEGDLFRLANEFALRHNKPTTRRDFEEPVWLAWIFYVYLATIRLTLELRRRSSAQDPPAQ